jgi:hypothetical protein
VSTERTSTKTRSGRRGGLFGYLGNVVDDTKDFVDDMLDRARDSEHDMRDTATRLVRYEDDDESEDVDLQTLKDDLKRLGERIEKLAAQQRPGQDRSQQSGS